MSLTNLLLMGVALVAAILLLQPRLVRNPQWRAVVTPLASIIGSGFLVAAPILSHAVGDWAWLAMLALCAIGYLFGTAVRFNIANVEPVLAGKQHRTVHAIERLAGLALAFAYFISVAYYLNLFAAFALRGFGISDVIWVRAVTSAVLLALAVGGFTGGLRVLERIETLAVGVKLAIIAGLLVALVAAGLSAVLEGSLVLPEISHDRGWNELRVVLGLVVLVQGFETSRYLGDEYDGALRVRTMRWAQIIATAIYLAFIVLATPYFTSELAGEGGETAIIDLLMTLGFAVAPLIILAALASQLSASVADLNGSGGLLAENLKQWVSLRMGYLITVGVALAITWTSNIYEIISYASRAFVAYYALQSLQALLAARRDGDHGRMALFAGAFVLALGILVFATPADV